ncbi:MAG: glycoside hydrolase domain-containing protein [Phycisphaerae bacterium]
MSTIKWLLLIALMIGCAPIAHGQKLYNASPMEPVGLKWSPPEGSSLEPVRIAGARNSVYSGMVICDGTLRSPARITNFRSPTGTIPASAVEITYPTRKADLAGGSGALDGKRDLFDALSPKPDPSAALQPILLTVHIPSDAKPGRYEATLKAGDKRAEIELTVVDFLLEEPSQWGMWVSTTQSPTTLSLRYDVSPYSDKHFKLIDQSLALQGALGDNVLYVPIIGKNVHGDEHGLVHFRQRGDDWVPDFTAFERYLDLYIKHCGKPRIVVAYLYDPYIGYENRFPRGHRRHRGARERESRGKTIHLSVIENGKLISREFPRPPAMPSVWKATLDGLQSVLNRKGVDADTLRLGTASDNQAVEDFVKFFLKIAPDLTWAIHTHGYGGRAASRGQDQWTDRNGMVVTYAEYPDPDRDSEPVPRPGNPERPFVVMQTGRDQHGDHSPPSVFRKVPTIALSASRSRNHVGLARVGLDLWPLSSKILPDRGKHGTVLGRYSWNRPNRLYRSATYAITAPGPDGPVATLRYEMLRQGTQEAEIMRRMVRRVVQLPEHIEHLEKNIQKCTSMIKMHGRRGPGKQATEQLPGLQKRLTKAKAQLGNPVSQEVHKRFVSMMNERYEMLFPGEKSPPRSKGWPRLNERFWSVAAEVLAR